MLKKVLLAIVVVVAVLAVVVATRPSTYRIQRSIHLAAPPEVTYAQVVSLHRWEAWSPWAKLDPAAKSTYEGPAAGVGAIFRWAGNNQVGEGSMTIMESRPAELVRFRLDFLKPFKVTNTAEFTFQPDGGQTVVTWSMTGKSSFICKAVGLFMNMDKMIGGQFEKGLADLKSVSEAAGKP